MFDYHGNMKKILVVLIVTVTTLLLVACSAINSGTITRKEYTEPYTLTTMQCMAFDASGICTMNMPVTQYYEETFMLNLASGDNTGWVYVNKAQYNAVNVGDHWGFE